jgi:hypothetical protein
VSGIKGYSDQKKSGDQQFITVGPVREQQNAADVSSHLYVQVIDTDASEAGSTTTVINATAHAALVGDIIRWTAGTLAKSEYVVGAIDTDTITVTEAMRAAPGTDAFKILRYTRPVVDSDGLISITAASGAVAFNLDGSLTEVNEDTGTPADNIPLPVKLVNASGDIIGQEAMAASIPVVIASDQSPVDVAQSGQWDITHITGTVSLPTGAATETTLAAIAADTGNIEADTANIAADTATIAADATTIAGDTTSLDGKVVQMALDEGAASGAIRTVEAKKNIAYTASGEIAGASLTGSYAALLDPSSDLRMLFLLNDCNNTVLVSLDGGSTDSFKLKAGESVALDLAVNGLKADNTVNISAKHGGAAPTSGSIRASGIG